MLHGKSGSATVGTVSTLQAIHRDDRYLALERDMPAPGIAEARWGKKRHIKNGNVTDSVGVSNSCHIMRQQRAPAAVRPTDANAKKRANHQRGHRAAGRCTPTYRHCLF